MDREKIDAVVTDGDNTLWKGRVAEGIGKAYLVRELSRLHLRNTMRGLGEARAIRDLTKDDGTAEVDGLRLFYGALRGMGLGERSQMYSYAKRHIAGNKLESVSAFISRLDMPKFLSTAGGSTGAAAAKEVFGLEDVVANIDVFDADSGKLAGVEIIIGSGEEKRELTAKMLERHGIRLENCAVIGNDSLDLPMMRSTLHRYASPLATSEVRAMDWTTLL